MTSVKLPWYRSGLKFTCTQCGRCCSGPTPGHVWVNEGEIDALAAHLNLEREQFGRRYLRRIGRQYSLIENERYDCIFWSDKKGCTVYEVRPGQCRQYPFWPELLEDRAEWDREARLCPGMNHGRHYKFEEIEAISNGG